MAGVETSLNVASGGTVGATTTSSTTMYQGKPITITTTTPGAPVTTTTPEGYTLETREGSNLSRVKVGGIWYSIPSGLPPSQIESYVKTSQLNPTEMARLQESASRGELGDIKGTTTEKQLQQWGELSNLSSVSAKMQTDPSFRAKVLTTYLNQPETLTPTIREYISTTTGVTPLTETLGRVTTKPGDFLSSFTPPALGEPTTKTFPGLTAPSFGGKALTGPTLTMSSSTGGGQMVNLNLPSTDALKTIKVTREGENITFTAGGPSGKDITVPGPTTTSLVSSTDFDKALKEMESKMGGPIGGIVSVSTTLPDKKSWIETGAKESYQTYLTESAKIPGYTPMSYSQYSGLVTPEFEAQYEAGVQKYLSNPEKIGRASCRERV